MSEPLKPLADQIAQLAAVVSQLQAEGVNQPVVPPTRRKCRMPTPERFSGLKQHFAGFITQAHFYLQQQPEDFPDDASKVAFLIGLFSEKAAQWAASFLCQNSPLLQDYNGFVAAMQATWGDPVREETANREIRRLHQGDGSAADYSTAFRLLAQDLPWGDKALQAQYMEGLSDPILDELARQDPATSLDQLVERVLRIDGRLESRRCFRPEPAFLALAGPPLPEPTFLPRTSATPRPPKKPTQESGARSPLTAEEKQHRWQSGLCFYCGEIGHFARSCPGKVPSAAAAGKSPPPGLNGIRSLGEVAPAFPQGGPVTKRDPLLVVATLQVPGAVTFQVGAMIDSGATSSFMDWAFAKRHGIPLQALATPQPVETIDGRLLRSGPVTHQTVPLLLTIQGHVETMQFLLAAIPHFPLVLGMPWLVRHDPHISWSRHEVLFASGYCQEHCWPQPVHIAAGMSAADTVSVHTEPSVTLPAKYRDFADVFDEKEADRLPPHREYDCPIDLVPGAPIPAGRLYSLSEPELAALRDFLEKNLKRGFIRPSTSPAGAPVLFVRKKSGELRLCCDYRQLNRVTIRNRYPLPLIPELLERVRRARVFTKLDLRGAYNLVRIRAGDEWKTAFQTRYGHYEYLVMPFGLCNAPAVFQRFVNEVFRDYLDRFVIIYLDDFLIYSPNQESHDAHVRAVLQRLREHGLYAKLDKCAFDLPAVDFLGHRVSAKGIEMDSMKVEAVTSWQAPRSRKDVQRFLGFANYYRRFIEGFATVAAPLNHLLRGKVPFSWTPGAQQAFEQLKECFTTEPILQYPDPQTPFVVEADASDVALGAVLLQPGPDGQHLLPCAFFSRQLTPAERNYTIWERELLAIKVALENWRHLLEGALHPVEVRTDHRNLEYLQTARKLNQRQKRWSLFFDRFNFRLTYIPQSQNRQADALSRKPEYAMSPVAEELSTIVRPECFGALVTPPPLIDQIRAGQLSDTWIQARAQGASGAPFSVQNGLVHHRGRLCVPAGSCREEVLQLCHDSRPAGHFGLFKTLHLVLRDFWWPRVRADVEQYVASCPVCRRAKDSTGKPSGLLQPLPTPSGPWKMVSMDFITDLPPSSGCTTIFVVVDLFSKMAHFVPCMGVPSAKETARLFTDHVFRLHGWPEGVVSDRGTQFTARFWRSLLQQLGIRSHLSSAFHPQTDGQTERTNRTLEQYLRCYGNYQQDDWAALLPLAEFAYNNAVHASTQQTPFRANYGFDPRPFPVVGSPSTVPAADQWLQELQAIQALLREQLDRAKEAYKETADARRQPGSRIQVGDRVWLSTRHLPRQGPCKKLGPRFVGPYKVTSQINPVAFRLQLPRSFRIHPVFHRSLLVLANEVRPDAGGVAPPSPVLVDGQEEYEVAQILDSRRRRGRLQYLVDWKGYGPEERSWEDAADVHAPALLHQFHTRYPAKSGPSRMGGGESVGEGSGVKPRRSPRIQPPPTLNVDSESEESDIADQLAEQQLGERSEAQEASGNESSDSGEDVQPFGLAHYRAAKRRAARFSGRRQTHP